MAAFSLGILRVLDLDPVRRWFIGWSIGPGLPLRHNTFQVEFADLLEELTAMRFDVIDVEDW